MGLIKTTGEKLLVAIDNLDKIYQATVKMETQLAELTAELEKLKANEPDGPNEEPA